MKRADARKRDNDVQAADVKMRLASILCPHTCVSMFSHYGGIKKCVAVAEEMFTKRGVRINSYAEVEALHQFHPYFNDKDDDL